MLRMQMGSSDNIYLPMIGDFSHFFHRFNAFNIVLQKYDIILD